MKVITFIRKGNPAIEVKRKQPLFSIGFEIEENRLKEWYLIALALVSYILWDLFAVGAYATIFTAFVHVNFRYVRIISYITVGLLLSSIFTATIVNGVLTFREWREKRRVRMIGKPKMAKEKFFIIIPAIIFWAIAMWVIVDEITVHEKGMVGGVIFCVISVSAFFFFVIKFAVDLPNPPSDSDSCSTDEEVGK